MQVAKVVLPRPGGPSNRMWPSGSLRLRAASTAISSRSATFRWPTISCMCRGRRAISSSRSLASASRDVAVAGSGRFGGRVRAASRQAVAGEDPFTGHGRELYQNRPNRGNGEAMPGRRTAF